MHSTIASKLNALGLLRSGDGGGGSNWWEVDGKTCVAAWQAIGAASQAGSYVNLANAGTYDLSAVNAPAWATETGWTFTAASSHYLTTGLVPTLDQTWSCFVRVASVTTGGVRTPVGMYKTGSERFYLWPVRGDGKYSAANGENTAYFDGGTEVTSGVFGFAGRDIYVDGTDTTNDIPVHSGTGTLPLFVGARNANGTPGYYMDGVIAAIAIYSGTLTSGEVSTLSAAMAAL